MVSVVTSLIKTSSAVWSSLRLRQVEWDAHVVVLEARAGLAVDFRVESGLEGRVLSGVVAFFVFLDFHNRLWRRAMALETRVRGTLDTPIAQ